MNYGGISLDAYTEHGSGFGTATSSDVDFLNKALEATSSRGGAVEGLTTASGAPLKVESLENNLKVVTFEKKHIVLWNNTPVLPAYNTVEEFNKLVSYGSDQGGFTNEGETPEEDDATYVRESELVKFMGNTRIVTHPMTLVNTAHGPVIQREIDNGTLWILEKLERALPEGNSATIPQEFNGWYKQQMNDFSSEIEYLDSDNVIDMRGYRVDESTLEEAANRIIENYGVPTDLFWAPRVGSEYVKSLHARQRLNPGHTGNSGARVTSFTSQSGDIPFHPAIFMRAKAAKRPTSPATSSKAPASPVAVGVTPVAATVANTKFLTGDNGNYLYAVSAFNRYGESAITVLDQNVSAIVVNGAADLAFSAGGGAMAPTGFRIYRAAKNATYSASLEFHSLFDVSVAQKNSGHNGASAGVVRDLNRWLPNTTSAFMVEKSLQVYSFKQLAPLMKMDLSVTSPAYRFMILLYGTPVVYAPRKMVRIINISNAVNAATNALIA